MLLVRITIPSSQPPWENIGGMGKHEAEAEAQTQEESHAGNEDWDMVHGDGRNHSKKQPLHKLTPM